MLVSVITNNICPNSRAFNCPLLASKPYFEEKGCNLKFHWKISEEVFNCDIIFINSNVFRIFWQTQKAYIFDFLEKAKSKKIKILWFDTTDSSWCTQFEVLPHVDYFLKSQIFADKNLYLQRFRSGRIFTDYFDALYQSGEDSESYPLPSREDLKKISVSWNTCFENYSESRYGFTSRTRQLLRPFTSSFLSEKLKIKFTPVKKERNIKISCRLGLSHSRPSVVAHRRAVIELMRKMGVSCSKIPLAEYFSELRNSQVGIGPFGVGEITLRDFEIMICGAALVKPDMSHLETWPELFQNNTSHKTYIPHSWDLSDLEEKIQRLLDNPELCEETAENAQKIYKDAVSPAGLANFAERLMKIGL